MQAIRDAIYDQMGVGEAEKYMGMIKVQEDGVDTDRPEIWQGVQAAIKDHRGCQRALGVDNASYQS